MSVIWWLPSGIWQILTMPDPHICLGLGLGKGLELRYSKAYTFSVLCSELFNFTWNKVKESSHYLTPLPAGKHQLVE